MLKSLIDRTCALRLGSIAWGVLAAGCGSSQGPWRAELVATTSGFQVPECALYAPDGGQVYVSNIASAPDEYWTDDGEAHISILGEDHGMAVERWVQSEPDQPIHAPKGMCLLGEYLYFADNSRLLRCDLAGTGVEVVASGFQKANDLCTDGNRVWLSDTATGKIFAISPEGEKREIPAPAGINGITFFGEKMFGVSWDLHEVYELDPSGNAEPVPFGLAEHFANLDSIEVLDDGTFVVSDFMGDKVSTISPDRTRVATLMEVPTPADIGLNRVDGLLYIPLFMSDELSVYRLHEAP